MPLNRYVLIFTVANVFLTIAVAVLAEALKLKSGSSFGLVVALGSSVFAAWAFVRNHERPPTPEEKNSFAWRALVSTLLVSLILSALVLGFLVAPSELKNMVDTLKSGTVLAMVAGALIFISAIYYLAIRWSFGWYANLASKQRS